MNRKSLIMVLLVSIMVIPITASAGALVIREPALWNDGELYRTVLTPKDLPDKAPDHSFDKLYNFDGSGLTGQRSVADAAPGDKDYNGGRWMVFAVTFTELGKSIHDSDDNGEVDFELMSEEMVLHHKMLGHLTISEEPVRVFECPMIKIKDNA